MGIKSFLKKYFSFNKRERNGVILLLLLIFVLIISNLYFKSKSAPLTVNIRPLQTEPEKRVQKIAGTSLIADTTKVISEIKSDTVRGIKSLFVFDPNSITEEQAVALGWSEKAAKTFMKFRSKGGKFKTKEDLKKLYGMTERLFSKLEPYVLIESDATEKKFTENKFQKTENKKYEKKLVEINAADSAQLVSLNGIGPALGRKIIKFRSMLGGFYAKEQLKEVYGMKDTLYNLFADRITVDASLVKKINVNTATSEDLRKNYYLKFNMIQSIVNYRMQHGKFTNAGDLLKVGSISEDVIKKLEPYLEF